MRSTSSPSSWALPRGRRSWTHGSLACFLESRSGVPSMVRTRPSRKVWVLASCQPLGIQVRKHLGPKKARLPHGDDRTSRARLACFHAEAVKPLLAWKRRHLSWKRTLVKLDTPATLPHVHKAPSSEHVKLSFMFIA